MRRRLAHKPKLRILSFGLLSVGACTGMSKQHMEKLERIYYYQRRQKNSFGFDDGPNGQERVWAVKDALASVNVLDPDGCNIVMDCLVFHEEFKKIQNQVDVYFHHCGQHPQNIRRLLQHQGGSTMTRFLEKYHAQFKALTDRLKEQRQAYACGARQAVPEVVCVCVCKSGRDRSVGCATVLQCVFTGGGKWNVVVEHLCRSDWRPNEGCQTNKCKNKAEHCAVCEQPKGSSSDVTLARGRLGKLAPGCWEPPEDGFSHPPLWRV